MNPQEMVFVALGSNLGDSAAIVTRAMADLSRFAAGPVVRSSLWRSEPVDCPPGSPVFVNAAAGFLPAVNLTPTGLWKSLRERETEFGRVPKQVMNEPRALDLDLIAFGQTRLETPELIVPHPRAALRAFVLAPLAEIVPDWVIPGQNLTVEQLLRTAADRASVRVL